MAGSRKFQSAQLKIFCFAKRVVRTSRRATPKASSVRQRHPTKTGRRKGEPAAATTEQLGHLPLAHVAEQLGINRQQALKLLRMQVLKRASEFGRPVQVDRSSFTKLLRALKRRDFLSLDAAAELLGCSTPRFRSNWVANGIVVVRDFGLWKFVTKGDVDKAVRLRKQYVTATEAGELLRTHRSHLPNLEKQGLITAFRFGKGRVLRLYDRESVRALAKKHRHQDDQCDNMSDG